MPTDPTSDAAFRAMYDATFADVQRFCLRRLPAADVNDAVSEVYLVAWQKPEHVPQGDGTLPWLYGVARNVVRHMQRGNRRRLRLSSKALREPVEAVSSPEMQVVRRSEDEALAAAIGTLSESDQEIIRLSAWEGLTAPAIAQVMGCSVSAAEKRVTRAFNRLEHKVASQSRAGVRRVATQGEAKHEH